MSRGYILRVLTVLCPKILYFLDPMIIIDFSRGIKYQDLLTPKDDIVQGNKLVAILDQPLFLLTIYIFLSPLHVSFLF